MDCNAVVNIFGDDPLHPNLRITVPNNHTVQNFMLLLRRKIV